VSRFDDTVVIVTGSGGGLGRAYAEAFATRGAAVIVADLDGDAASSTAEAIRAAGGDATAVTVDVSEESSVRALVDATVTRYGGVDVLVNNAAVMFRSLEDPRKPFWQYSVDEFDRVHAVNVRGTWLCIRETWPSMAARGGGKIVNVSSNMAYGTDLPFPAGMSAYTSSKAAVIGLTRALAGELGREHITVNAVAPGVTTTETVLETIDEARLDAMTEVQALKRLARPADIVGTVLFLASSDSDFMTGQTLIVDGGFMTA
jgi:3-oxoacyl-[acyl-carrier protein] reductase